MSATSLADSLAELDQLVPAAMDRLRVPGVVVGLRHEGAEEIAAYGMTSVEHPLPVDADTLFQIGSITKTFVASLMMRLVEAGMLDLEAPLRAYLPELRPADADAARVTLAHLLTHTAGWEGDYFDDFGAGDDALARYVAGMAALPRLTPPGQIFNYNNAGFSLAGRLVEVVTGQPFEAALRERLLAPLGMERAFFFAEEVISERFAVGHLVRDERPTVARPWALSRCAHPAGGLTTSVRDLLRYARFSLGDGTADDGARLLSRATLAAMRAPRVATNMTGGAVGLAWMLSASDGVHFVQHGGATNGQMANLLLAPERDLAVIVLTNGGRGNVLAAEVTRWALERRLGLGQPDPTPRPRPAAELAAYVGRYTQRLTDVELALAGDELVMTMIPKGGFPKTDSPPRPAPPPARLGFYDQDRALVLDTYQRGTRVEFVRDAGGAIAWLRSGVRLHARQP